MNPAKSAWRAQVSTWRAAHVQIGASEALFLAGLACLFLGLLIWLGLGVALASSGGVMIITSIINDLMISARVAKHV